MKLIYSEHPKSIISFLIIALITSLTPPAIIALNKYTIDNISLIGSNPDIYKTVMLLLVATFVIQYFTAVLSNIDEYIFVVISQSVNFVLKKLLIEKQFKIPMEKYEESAFFDKLNLANNAISYSGVGVVSHTFEIGKSIVSLLGILGLLMTIHWTMPLALFLSTLPGIVVLFITKQQNYKMNVATSPASRQMEFTDKLFSTKNSLAEIKIFGLGDYLLNRWGLLFSDIRDHNLKIAKWEAKAKSVAVLFLQLSSFLVSLLLVHQISDGRLSIGDYVALIGAVTVVQGLFASAGGSVSAIYEVAIYNDALLEVLEHEVDDNEIKIGNRIDEINTIELEDISFKYPDEQNFAIENVNLIIKKGKSVSIVGYNGSGKSTLVKCLTGLYNVTSGRILINDVDYKDIAKSSLFERISIVMQDFYKYKYTVRENIGFGNLENLKKDEKLNQLLQDVDLLERINKTQMGIDSYLTKEMPYGVDLSGGEWQRIAIARAQFKNADLVILDEPTAAIDPISEVSIFKLFKDVSKNKTSITISHRLGPTKFSDRIIVMDKGRIVEDGHFDELISSKGLFFEMYQAQADWYREEVKI